MTRQPRFEICRDDSGWWARFRAANGRVVWVTETYTRRRAAVAAIHQVAPAFDTPWPVAVWVYPHGAIEVREIDYREQP